MLEQLVFTFPIAEASATGTIGRVLAGLFLARIHFGVIFPDDDNVNVYLRDEADNRRDFLKLCKEANLTPSAFKIEPAAQTPA